MLSSRLQSGLVFAGLAFLAACSDDNSPTEPGSPYSTIQLGTAAGPAFLTLGTTASVAAVVDPTTSTAWDLGFTSTPTVTVNGGASGPGGVKAYCLCANRTLTLAQVEALTSAQGADAFGAVTSANIPADASFQSDAASMAIAGWYDYNPATHAVSANDNVWAVRLASTSGNYAQFHVKSIPNPGQSAAGSVTLEWAIQGGGSGTLGANQTLTVDVASGAKVYVNLTSGTSSATPAAGWDVALQGYMIYVNGGASGSGGASAIQIAPSPYASYSAITQIPIGAQGIPTSVFVADGAGGAFTSDAPYRYASDKHQVYPTYDVYLVKKGKAVYKVQVASYYNATTGAFGTITVRYAKLTD